MGEGLIARIAVAIGSLIARVTWSKFDRWRQRPQLTFMHNPVDEPPYMVRRSAWSDGKHSELRFASIGVRNDGNGAVAVRVVVESRLDGATRTPIERTLRVFGTENDTTVPVAPTATAYFEVAMEVVGSEWVYICYANPSHEDYAGRHNLYTMRAEGGSTTRRCTVGIKTHVAEGKRVPFTLQLIRSDQ